MSLESSPHESPRALARVSIIVPHDYTADDRRHAPGCPPQQVRAVCRQVLHAARRKQGEAVEVDHVDVTTLADFEGAAVVQALARRGFLRLHLHGPFERELRAALSTLHPVAELIGGYRRRDPLPLNDRADIAQAAIQVAEIATRTTEFAFRAAGAHPVDRSVRIQRCLRDMWTGRQSLAMSDEVWERIGQVRLGVAPPNVAF